jgi:hypothetical protein
MTSTRQPHRESPAIGKFMGRMTKALIRRAQGGDADALVVLVDLQRQAQVAVVDAGRALIAAGYSYSDLARELGVSRQAALKRFGPADAPVGGDEVATGDPASTASTETPRLGRYPAGHAVGPVGGWH